MKTKDEIRATQKEWCVRNKERLRITRNKYYKRRKRENPKHFQELKTRDRLRSKFGLTLEDYDKLFEQQNGVCKICGGVNKDGRRLFVDHNHKTGKIRDLLCFNCNSVIGLVGEDEKRLLLMSLYLRRHNDDK